MHQEVELKVGQIWEAVNVGEKYKILDITRDYLVVEWLEHYNNILGFDINKFIKGNFKLIHDVIDPFSKSLNYSETKGEHYKLQIDPYEYCFKNQFNPLQFNAIKYISRYKLKNGKQDLEKAINTLQRLIELEYEN